MFDVAPRVAQRAALVHSVQPERYSGRMYCWAEAMLTVLRLGRSHTNRWPVRSATLPSSNASVTLPENSKFAPGLVLPPLQASSHSRSLPGERGNVFGGCLKPFIFASGINLGLLPLNPHRIVPRSPMNSRPS